VMGLPCSVRDDAKPFIRVPHRRMNEIEHKRYDKSSDFDSALT
jgi:hypothetical protein